MPVYFDYLPKEAEQVKYSLSQTPLQLKLHHEPCLDNEMKQFC